MLMMKPRGISEETHFSFSYYTTAQRCRRILRHILSLRRNSPRGFFSERRLAEEAINANSSCLSRAPAHAIISGQAYLRVCSNGSLQNAGGERDRRGHCGREADARNWPARVPSNLLDQFTESGERSMSLVAPLSDLATLCPTATLDHRFVDFVNEPLFRDLSEGSYRNLCTTLRRHRGLFAPRSACRHVRRRYIALTPSSAGIATIHLEQRVCRADSRAEQGWH